MIDSGTGSSRAFAHPRDDARSGQCTETLSTRTRTRTPTRIENTHRAPNHHVDKPAETKAENPSGPPAQVENQAQRDGDMRSRPAVAVPIRRLSTYQADPPATDVLAGYTWDVLLDGLAAELRSVL
nr:hypothetical protein GCM10017611_73810 [Rhodococcus wratislaviensis]